MATRSDPVGVRRHDEEHLRRFLAARKRGDAAEMRRWWDELVVDVFDRIEGLVYTVHRGRLDADEHELAVQLAMIRFSTNLIRTFHGVSMGQLVNATRTLVRGICMDVQARSIADRRHGGVSLDDGVRDTDDDAPGPSWAEGDAARRRFEDEERSRDATDFLDWALPQVAESRRRVLELTFEGAELDEICSELSLTHDNAYQRRSRGMKDLRKLKEQYDT